MIDPGWKRRRQSRRRPAGKPGTPAASPGRSFGRVAAAYELGRPSFVWRDALAGSPFEELRSAVIAQSGEVDRAVLIARIGSWSQVATLPDAERDAFLAEIAGHLTEPSYRAMLETHLYWTRLAR